jgi:ankyrin repeat protein
VARARGRAQARADAGGVSEHTSYSARASLTHFPLAHPQEKRTPLHVAALYGHLEAVKAALHAGADLNREDVVRTTIFFRRSPLPSLTAPNPPPSPPPFQAGRSAFLVAAGEGHTAVAEHLLAVDGTQIDAATHTGNSAAHRAAAYGHAPLLRVLLRAGAEVDSLNDDGESPLIRACRWGHEDAARVLVQAGADASLRDVNGRSAADWATAKGFSELLAVLANERPLPSVLSPKANKSRLMQEGLLASPAVARAGAAGGRGGGGGGGGETDEDDEDVGMGGVNARGAGDTSLGSAFSGAAGGGAGGADGGVGADGSEGGGGDGVRVEGWMAKQGHFIRNWKNRWFTLDGRTMSYFGKEGAAKPKGTISLGAGTDVIVEEKYAKPYCFTLLTPKKKFILQAANEDEMVEWIEAIQTNLETCAPEEGGGGAQGGDEED